MTTLNLDIATVSAQIHVSRATLDSANDPEVVLRQELDRLIIKLNAKVAADSKESIYWTVGYPASWWQHFKRDVLVPFTANPSTPLGRWLFEWATQVDVTHQEFERDVYTRVCPHINVKDLSQHVEWLTWQP